MHYITNVTGYVSGYVSRVCKLCALLKPEPPKKRTNPYSGLYTSWFFLLNLHWPNNPDWSGTRLHNADKTQLASPTWHSRTHLRRTHLRRATPPAKVPVSPGARPAAPNMGQNCPSPRIPEAQGIPLRGQCGYPALGCMAQQTKSVVLCDRAGGTMLGGTNRCHNRFMANACRNNKCSAEQTCIPTPLNPPKPPLNPP